MDITELIESGLAWLLIKKSPTMPLRLRNWLVRIAPLLSLTVGILSLISLFTLVHWAQNPDDATKYLQEYHVAMTGSALRATLYLSSITIALEGLLFVLAYPGLRRVHKSGWNYVFYGGLVNVMYSVASLFVLGGSAGELASRASGSLIGMLIGFWILFQLRSAYADTSKD